MGILTRNLYPIVTALCLTVWNSVPVAAQTDISGQLEALKSAGPAEATQLTREIELEWSKSGSTALDLLLRRGQDAMENDDLDTAIEHLTALTDHAPDFAEGFHARATAYFRAEKYGPAFEDLQRALILNPLNYNAIFGLGVMFAEVEDFDRAERAFRQVLDIHPNHEGAGAALDRLKTEGLGREL
ncbi:MAG: tetratricopeptide repeat protein [Pseudomonadota bacterium]